MMNYISKCTRITASLLALLLILGGCAQRTVPSASPSGGGQSAAVPAPEEIPAPLDIRPAVTVIDENTPELHGVYNRVVQASKLFYRPQPDAPLVEITLGENSFYSPRLSPDGTRLLLRTSAYNETLDSVTWTAYMVHDLVTGQQFYCQKEPYGNKHLVWLGDGIIGCVVEPHNGGPASDLYFFDAQFRTAAPPVAFDGPDAHRQITGLWFGDGRCYLMALESEDEITDFQLPQHTLYFEVWDAAGRRDRHVLPNYAAIENTYRGFGNALRPMTDGRLLARLQPASLTGEDDGFSARWAVLDPEKGFCYEIPGCYSIRAFDGERLLYSEAGDWQNRWNPAATLCVLGQNGPEQAQPVEVNALTDPADPLHRYRVDDPEEPLWGESGVFCGDSLYLTALVGYTPASASADYVTLRALLRYDLAARTAERLAIFPENFRLTGLTAGGKPLVLGPRVPAVEYAALTSSHFKAPTEADYRAAAAFWNTRGQLLLAADFPTFGLPEQTLAELGLLSSLVYDVSWNEAYPPLTPEALWRGVNRVYAYRYWQNERTAPATLVLTQDELTAQLQTLFGQADSFLALLDDYRQPDGGYLLDSLTPDPVWDSPAYAQLHTNRDYFVGFFDNGILNYFCAYEWQSEGELYNHNWTLRLAGDAPDALLCGYENYAPAL